MSTSERKRAGEESRAEGVDEAAQRDRPNAGQTFEGGERASAPERQRAGAAVWVATAGGVGFGPWAPGTWGALATVLLFVLLFGRLELWAYLGLTLAVIVVGIWASGASEEYFGKHDDGRIVIDEVAGQMITLLPLVPLSGLDLGRVGLPEAWTGVGSAMASGLSVHSLLVVTAFVAFRWFDIRKPGAVKRAEERFAGGLGVMADDIVAGLMGAVVVTVPAYVAVLSQFARAMAQG